MSHKRFPLLAAFAVVSALGAPLGRADTPSPTTEAIAERIFSGGLKGDWRDSGWCSREIQGPAAAIHFGSRCAWILSKPDFKPGPFGALVFREKSQEAQSAEPLEIRLDATGMRTFPRVVVRGDQRTDGSDGWSRVRISMLELNPEDLPFDRVIFHSLRDADTSQVTFIDDIGLTPADASARARDQLARAKPISVQIAGDAVATPVSPLIYGIAYYAEADAAPVQWNLGATARRFGGNTSSRYNWELGAWNTASDWFFENKAVPSPHTKFLRDNQAHGLSSALTVPILGWVAKDTTSFAFPATVFGPQTRSDPWQPDAGDGTKPSGGTLTPGPPTQTSVAEPPESVERWVKTLRASDAKGKRSVDEYILDNEPMNWTRIHRDVRTKPLGYDELLQRTIQYGGAIRRADPEAVIAGPALWGWTAYFFSALDGASGFTARPDRRAHGDLPLVAWYLRKLHEHEAQTGERAIDVLDLHFYPQAEHVYGNGGNDPATAALRLRQTRGLWDPTYVDESWIKEPIRLLPRMKEWIDQNYPGIRMSIGEWNFGGEGHVSGALAIAEALGRFAQFGVYSAFYWTFPPEGAPAIQGFRAFRNFDGAGGRFLDWYVPSSGGAADVSVFASRDEVGQHLVLVEINRSADQTYLANLQLNGCGPIIDSHAYAFGGGRSVFTAVPPTVADADRAATSQLLAPWSITVVDLKLAHPMTGSAKR